MAFTISTGYYDIFHSKYALKQIAEVHFPGSPFISHCRLVSAPGILANGPSSCDTVSRHIELLSYHVGSKVTDYLRGNPRCSKMSVNIRFLHIGWLNTFKGLHIIMVGWVGFRGHLCLRQFQTYVTRQIFFSQFVGAVSRIMIQRTFQ